MDPVVDRHPFRAKDPKVPGEGALRSVRPTRLTLGRRLTGGAGALETPANLTCGIDELSIGLKRGVVKSGIEKTATLDVLLLLLLLFLLLVVLESSYDCANGLLLTEVLERWVPVTVRRRVTGASSSLYLKEERLRGALLSKGALFISLSEEVEEELTSSFGESRMRRLIFRRFVVGSFCLE